MQRLNLDMLGVVALATLVLIATLIGLDNAWIRATLMGPDNPWLRATLMGLGNPWIRATLALPLALYGVGYAVGKVFFPARPVGFPERFLLSLGLSLCVLILTGLLLNILPGGLQPQTWAVMLFLISLAAANVVIFQRLLAEGLPSTPADSQPSDSPVWQQAAGAFQSPFIMPAAPADTGRQSSESLDGSDLPKREAGLPGYFKALPEYFHRWLRPASGRPADKSGVAAGGESGYPDATRNRKAKPLHVLTFGLSVLIVIFSLGLALLPAPPGAHQGYSMLWMAPDPSGTSEQIELGVRSMEFSTRSYWIELYDGGKLVQRWDDIQLSPKQEWTLRLNMDDYRSGKGALEANLYRVDRPNAPYRQVRLWLPTASKSPLEGQ